MEVVRERKRRCWPRLSSKGWKEKVRIGETEVVVVVVVVRDLRLRKETRG